jgi:hypothetical protein
MKPSSAIAIRAFVIGAIVAGGVYWFFPGLHWGVYVGLFFLSSAAAYRPLLADAANKKTVDRP